MKKRESKKDKYFDCPHKNLRKEGGYLVCQDCGLVLNEEVMFSENSLSGDSYGDSQLEYEKRISYRDSKAKQDPRIKEKYDRIKTIDKWYKDSQSGFGAQKKTLELLRSFNIGLNIDQTKYQEIKKRYQRYNRNHRKTYQNMVIIFLAIVWMEIKDTTNIRIEQYIDACNQLGHKVNKKMLNKAMAKIRKTEEKWSKYQSNLIEGSPEQLRIKLENEIKKKIKILFQKNLNAVLFEDVKHIIEDKKVFEKLKIDMQLYADEILRKISYEDIKNLNYKALTAGLVYYVSKILEKGKLKLFTQNLVEDITNFSSTTIRKKYHMLVNLLGQPKE